ncbi:hypothetical protein [Acinetobacter baumannii]|uniref:hypothetical protein n=1 Tax=Acinetobacter baumannii TaxID=470 RepID=UPI003891E8F6
MTVQVSDRLSQLYVGNGINTRFDFTFRAFEQEDETGIGVRVKVGNDFEFIDESEYAVTLNPDNLGGYVTFVEPPSAVTFFYIAGKTPVDQLLDITNYDNFYPDAIERALDKLTAILQEWKHLVDFETQARILADIDYDELAKQREADLKAYIDGIASAITGQPVLGLPAEFVVDGPKTQKQINDQIKAKLGHFKLLQDYITPDMTDHTQAILLAISENDFLDFGTSENTYYISQPIALKSGMTIVSNGAKFIAKKEIANDFTPHGLFEAKKLVGVQINGEIKTEIDHTLFTNMGDIYVLKPTTVALLADNCIDCDFGFFKCSGASNYYYDNNFKEYGIVDVRNSTDCKIRFDVKAGFGSEIVNSSPSTNGGMFLNNTRLQAWGRAEGCYWSGILFYGTDCKLYSPIVLNTKGASLNLGGLNTHAYNVDLKDSKQGNLTFGHGINAINCSVVGGKIRGAQYANIAFLEETGNGFTTVNCKALNVKLEGWGLSRSSQQNTVCGVRLEGHGNEIDVECELVTADYTAFGYAAFINAITLSTPSSENHIVKIKSKGAGVSLSAPGCSIDVDVQDATDGSALSMGYRCAKTNIKRVKAKNCFAPISHSPNSADINDAIGIRIGEIISNDCQRESILPLPTGRLLPPVVDVIKSEKTELLLNEILYALRTYTADSSVPGSNKLAAALELLTVDSTGASYGIDVKTSTVSNGNLVNTSHKFRHSSFEIASVLPTQASQLIAQGADGKRYALSPPTGGGAATWVLIP